MTSSRGGMRPRLVCCTGKERDRCKFRIINSVIPDITQKIGFGIGLVVHMSSYELENKRNTEAAPAHDGRSPGDQGQGDALSGPVLPVR